MSDNPVRSAIEAVGGSFRLLGVPFMEAHRKKYGEDAAVNDATAKVVVKDLQADPELAPAFKKELPRWEDLTTRAAKVAVIDEFGLDEFMRLSREGHARAKAKGR